MVVATAKGWRSDLRLGAGLDGRGCLEPDSKQHAGGLGILAFEAAATMSRLVSLHCTLSERELLRLRSDTMRSQGVAYLNSTDQSQLLRLACAELMDDLNRAAAAISRLGIRCSEPFLQRFDRVYADLKAGAANLDLVGLGYTKKVVEKRMKKMEKYVAATSKLCAEMEALGELEAMERKMGQQWSRYSGPIPVQKPIAAGDLALELKSRRQRVKRLRDDSLWSQSFDKAVGLMARGACSVFARICVVFGPIVPSLPPVVIWDRNRGNSRISFAPISKSRIYPRFPFKFLSGPLERRAAKDAVVRNSCPIIGATKDVEPNPLSKTLVTPSHTVGGSGVALRYADMIVLAEKLLNMRSTDEVLGEEEQREEAAAREELYRMLPAGLRAAVKDKLRDTWRDPGPSDGSLAAGWKEAVERIMVWLEPMAHDTLRWQAERNLDRRQRFNLKPRALMLHTLHFSDREKTEAAIVEVLVGLSCVYWYEERRRGSLRV